MKNLRPLRLGTPVALKKTLVTQEAELGHSSHSGVTRVIAVLESELLYCSCEYKRDQTLRRQAAQTVFTPSLSRALRWALVLLLLLTQQSWSGIACLCKPRSESQSASQHACSQAAPTSVAETHQGGDTHSSCLGAGATSQDIELNTSPQGAHVCCQTTQPAEAQGAVVSAPNPVLVENTLPSLNIGAAVVTTPVYFGVHRPPRRRPLYLAFSCLLI